MCTALLTAGIHQLPGAVRQPSQRWIAAVVHILQARGLKALVDKPTWGELVGGLHVRHCCIGVAFTTELAGSAGTETGRGLEPCGKKETN